MAVSSKKHALRTLYRQIRKDQMQETPDITSVVNQVKALINSLKDSH